MKKIWIVIVYSRRDKYNTGVAVNQQFFETNGAAMKFCESRLTPEEVERHYKQLQRGLISWYEYSNKDYIYEIKELERAIN